jgi:hypothetical protein
MKKLLLAVGLCVVAFVVAPIASATAEPLEGGCVITAGKAKFFKAGSNETEADSLTETAKSLGYNFKGEETGGVPAGLCIEGQIRMFREPVEDMEHPTLPGDGAAEAVVDIEEIAGLTLARAYKIMKVKVTGGEGENLTCVGEGKGKVDGTGELELLPLVIGTPKTVKFDLDFKTKGGIVILEIEAKGEETVTANGAAEFFTSTNQPAANCALSGVEELEFKAAAFGSIG